MFLGLVRIGWWVVINFTPRRSTPVQLFADTSPVEHLSGHSIPLLLLLASGVALQLLGICPTAALQLHAHGGYTL